MAAPARSAALSRPPLPGFDLRGRAARAARALAARLPWIAAGLAAAIPVIGSTVDAVRAGWVPAGDDGIIATRGWDVLTSHTPLVGQYSEAGLVVHGQALHSPGPMLYWLLALPARFGSVTSIAVTVGAVDTLAIVACVALARRRGGLPLMFMTAAAIALMCRSLPAEALHDVWNPAAGLFPFLLLVFLGWSLACGEYRLLPLAVLVASFVTQTHLMYLLPTAVVLGVGIGGLCLPRPPARIWPWALAAALVAVVCWAAPTIEQLEHDPGNLRAIVRTAEHRGPTLGASVGWHAVVRSVGVRPWWVYAPASEWERKADVRVRPSRGASRSTVAILAALALTALLGLLARRRDLAAAALIAIGLCAAIALQAASNPARPLLAETLGYTMWWGSELGLWVWLVLAWALALALLALLAPAFAALRRLTQARRPRAPGAPARRHPRSPKRASAPPRRACAPPRRAPAPSPRARRAAVVLASLAGLGLVAAVGAASARDAKPDSHAYEYRPIRALAARLTRLIPPRQTLAYRFGALDLGTQPIEPALRFLLVRHRDRVLAPGSLPRLGSYYELYRRPTQWVVYLTDGARPQPQMTLAARVHFEDPWGREVLSAWVRRTRAGT